MVLRPWMYWFLAACFGSFVPLAYDVWSLPMIGLIGLALCAWMADGAHEYWSNYR